MPIKKEGAEIPSTLRKIAELSIQVGTVDGGELVGEHNAVAWEAADAFGEEHAAGNPGVAHVRGDRSDDDRREAQEERPTQGPRD